MKGLGETSPFHRFTNHQCDKSIYFWSWDSYLLFIGVLYAINRFIFMCDFWDFGKAFQNQIT